MKEPDSIDKFLAILLHVVLPLVAAGLWAYLLYIFFG